MCPFTDASGATRSSCGCLRTARGPTSQHLVRQRGKRQNQGTERHSEQTMIKQVVWGACVVIATAGTAEAQGPAQQGPVGLTQYLQKASGNIKGNLTEAANKLSDADYAFKPTTMPEVRTFGQLFGHVANA